ncbi:hypothetical protein D3C75_884830 [compost metagenome]
MRGQEASLGERVPGRLGFRDQGDLFTVETRLVGIAFLVVRGKIAGGDTASGLQRRVEYRAVMIGIARALQ